MSDVQIINQDGVPAFAVVPYDLWLSMAQKSENKNIPQAVIVLQHKYSCSLISAWRRHKKVSQVKLAELIGVTQSAIAQIEKAGNQPQTDTLNKIADALGIPIEELTEY